MTRNTTRAPEKIQPRRTRYIKLGREGGWEQECLKDGIIRFGFDTSSPERFPLCQTGRWDELTKSLLKHGKTKGTATNIANQARAFFEDDGTTLWITFFGERLYWGFTTTAPAKRHDDGKGVWREMQRGWSYTDLNGEELTTDRLSGALTKLRSYRGTSCDVDVIDYVVQRINGEKSPQVEQAIAALAGVKSAVLEMLKLLGPGDFEILVDIVFTTSGWRRLGVVGKTMKTLDLDVILPSTGERAFIQVKAKTSSAELAEYIDKFAELEIYSRMFFVYHSGEAESDDERVTVIGPEKLSDLIIDAGLVNWLIRKIS